MNRPDTDSRSSVDRRVVSDRRVQNFLVEVNRRHDARRFDDHPLPDDIGLTALRSLEAARMDPDDDERPYSPCRWADVPMSGRL